MISPPTNINLSAGIANMVLPLLGRKAELNTSSLAF